MSTLSTTTRRARRTVALAVLALGITACGGGETVQVIDLEVGDCFDDTVGMDGDTVLDLPSVDCLAPHDNEVVARWELDLDGEFPGEEEVVELAMTGCIERFEGYVGTPYDDSVLAVFPFSPTAGGWIVGDRLVICSAYDAELSKLTGSVRGSGR